MRASTPVCVRVRAQVRACRILFSVSAGVFTVHCMCTRVLAFASSYHFWIPAQVCTTSHKGCNAQPRSPPPPVKCGVRAVGSGRIVEITGITITITIIEVTLASISVYIQWEGEKKEGRKEGRIVGRQLLPERPLQSMTNGMNCRQYHDSNERIREPLNGVI